MACGSCSVGKDGKPGGCNGSCSGGCNRLNTFDWLSKLDIEDVYVGENSDLVEITFKSGTRKEIFHNPMHTHTTSGDMVLVEIPGGGGYDVGQVSLSGELVRLQMKKKGIKISQTFLSVIRRANERDLERMREVRTWERDTMIKARAIARTLELDMKVGDVEYQADGRKCTFFYIADGRVDFRELIRHYAKEFKVKIEMRQIGARQESARIGGLGSCGRELCCSTWLSDFKSVSTVAARYQNLAINQAKLSGACGRLKCCLNYELNTYIDALQDFPDHAERLKTKSGNGQLIKTDVFKGLMTYVMTDGTDKGKFCTLGIQDVKEVKAQNRRGEYPDNLKDLHVAPTTRNQNEDGEDIHDEPAVAYEDVIGAVELRDDKKKRPNKKKKPQQQQGKADFKVNAETQVQKQPQNGGQKNPNNPNNNNNRNKKREKFRNNNNNNKDKQP